MRFARVAVTGSRGRLGGAVVQRLRGAGIEAVPLSRPDYDLDDEGSAAAAVADGPDLVVHCAAWTDVDGCARDPDLAHRRNALAVRALAAACRERGVPLLHISTNEVFDGRRTDGLGYREDETPSPINPYGASKLAGEQFVAEAYRGSSTPWWIVRTAWLFGPPGDDFPVKILRAARRLPPGDPLRVVADEHGAPTYVIDLAAAIVALAEGADGGVYHLTNAGYASRFDWAAAVLDACDARRPLQPISSAQFTRASQPPAWAVLDTSRAARDGVALRSWQDAFREYAPFACAST